MVNLTWLLLWGISRLYCISFVFNLNPERKEGKDLGISRGIQLYFLSCSLQYNDFATGSLSALSVFSDFISVGLKTFIFLGGPLSDLFISHPGTISQFQPAE